MSSSSASTPPPTETPPALEEATAPAAESSASAPSGSSRSTSTSGGPPPPLMKPVFASPKQIEVETGSSSSSSSSKLEAFINKHSFPEELERSYKSVRKEEHEKHVRGLRKELDYIANTNWMYEAPEKLTGQ